jgi:hypothetical protein
MTIFMHAAEQRFHEDRAFPLLIFCYDSDEVLGVQGLCFMFCEIAANMEVKRKVLTSHALQESYEI